MPTIWLLLCSATFAGDTLVIGGLDGLDPNDLRPNYHVLMALSGGGARGLATIGILRAFEEKGIKVDAIAGASMGGVVGGLYACGYSPDELTSIMRTVDYSDLFSNQPARSSMFLTQRQERDRHLVSVRFHNFVPVIPKGLTAGQKLTSLLASLSLNAGYQAGGDFTKFRIPFKTVTTDIISGRMVVLSDGSLADALRATMAFPLAFTGLERDNELLMDGGMVMPVPVEIVKAMHDGFAVAVNTTSPLVSKNDLNTPVEIANQVTTIMVADQLADQLKLADYVIAPLNNRYNSTSFEHQDSIIASGYHTGQSAADSIIALLRAREEASVFIVDSVTVLTPQAGLADMIASRLQGKALTNNQLIAELKSLTRSNNLFEISVLRTATPSRDSAVDHATHVILRFEATPSPRTSDVRFVLRGNRLYSQAALLSAMHLDDSLLTPYSLHQALDRIVQLYRSSNHDLANIRHVQIDHSARVVTIDVDEAIIRRVDVTQNSRTRPWFVRSYFPIKSGESYSTRKASRGIANIYGTDLFERVGLDLVRLDSGAAVSITVQEKNYNQLRFGWHWYDHYQSEQFIEALDDNIAGIGIEFLLHAQYGLHRQSYYADLRSNRIFSTYLTGQTHLHYLRQLRNVYDGGTIVDRRTEERWGGTLSLGQQIARLGTVSGRLSVEQLRYRYENSSPSRSFILSSVSFESLVETFDRWPFPSSGKKHLLEIQWAEHFFGGKERFTRLLSTLESYFQFGSFVNYHPKLSIGLSGSGLPASEQFYFGGPNSFMGYRTDELAGDKMILVNQELRFRLPLRFYVLARYDIGNLYISTDELKLENLRHGFGAAIAFDAPIGPIEFSYGRSSKKIDTWYFTAGLQF